MTDYKYQIQTLAELLAEQDGKVYEDLTLAAQFKVYCEADRQYWDEYSAGEGCGSRPRQDRRALCS